MVATLKCLKLWSHEQKFQEALFLLLKKRFLQNCMPNDGGSELLMPRSLLEAE